MIVIIGLNGIEAHKRPESSQYTSPIRTVPSHRISYYVRIYGIENRRARILSRKEHPYM